MVIITKHFCVIRSMSVKRSSISSSSRGENVRKKNGSGRRNIKPAATETTAVRTPRVATTTTTRAKVENPDKGVAEERQEGRNPSVPARFSATTTS